MKNWKNILKADPTDWLLEEENPSVRYFALKELLDKPEHDIEVQNAKGDIMQSVIVRDILKRQQEPEYLKSYPNFYTDKYTGLVWQLIVLAELAADANEHIKKQCEYILYSSQEIHDGGFAMHTSAKTGGGRITEVIPCLSGNMVWSLIKLGYFDDTRVQKGIDWICRHMRYNDGIEVNKQAAPYNRYETCWGRHTCHMGVVKTLKALSAIPAAKRTPQINETIEKAAEFILIHHIYKRSHNLNKISKPGWLKFGFPLMYQTDILEILDILTELGIKDDRMNDALEIVISKQDNAGKYKLENSYASDKLLISMENKGFESKWITLRALRIIKRYEIN